MLHESFSAEDTAALAANMARKARPGDVVALTGPLGAGKTAFAQGFALGLGYTGVVTSPSFTIMNVCEGGRLPLYHFDLYRLPEGGKGLEDIGCEDYFYGDGVCLIEWADLAADCMPDHTSWISLEPDAARGESFRLIGVPEVPA